MFASFALFLVAFLLFLLLFRIRRPNNFPPGPRPIPFLGNLLQLSLDHPLVSLERLTKQYGKIYSLFIGQRPAVVLNGVQAIKEALVFKATDFAGRPQDLLVNHAVQKNEKGPGVILVDYNQGWKEQRRFGLMSLRNFGLGKESMEQRILGETQCIIKILEQNVGKTMNPKVLFHNAASNIISKVLYGKRHDYDDESLKFYVGLFHDAARIFNGRWGLLYDFVPIVRSLPLPFKKAFKLLTMAHEKQAKLVAEIKKNRVTAKPQHITDCYLDEIDKRRDEDSSFCEDQLSAFALDFHFAGTETTANTLLTAFLYLMNHPHIQERCQQEIDKGLDGKDQASFEDRHQMPYVQGTIVIVNLSSSLSEEGQWKFPGEFNPENFLNEQGEFVKPEIFMPFSAGPRMCLGEALARMELFLITVSLLRKYKFIWPENAGEPDYTPVFGLSQTPKPYHMKVQLRD
ncbi:cytochrome P450 2D14-like isoform X2 [Genypterus blacodes]|uniref:cytochrome P450 2D14-like isoform X2 n=1 Tax=Genypterus blacodes TaxID=154954 RepID=UPI003F772B24